MDPKDPYNLIFSAVFLAMNGKKEEALKIAQANINLLPASYNLAAIYAQKCASCHGANAEGGPGGPRLFGGIGTLKAPQQPVQTVAALKSAVQQGGTRPLLLLVNREGHDLFLTASAS